MLKIILIIVFFLSFSIPTWANQCHSLFVENNNDNKYQKIFETPEDVKNTNAIMIFDHRYRKVVTAAIYNKGGELKKILEVSPYYENMVNVTFDYTLKGAITQTHLILPKGRYELVFLEIQGRDDTVIENSEANEVLRYKSLREALVFEVKSNFYYVR